MTEQPRVDEVAFFDRLGDEMNAHPDRYDTLGDVDLVLGLVIARPDGDPFRARVTFEGIGCIDVSAMEPGDEALADCWLEGPLDGWQSMVADIIEHGGATGPHTLNSLTLVGETIRLRGSDVMGIDKFSRFNQSLQEFFDGAAQLPALRAAG